MNVSELKELCDQMVKNGFGDREIYISDDEEGNGFHQLIYGFSDDPDILTDLTDDDDLIILG